MKPTDLPKNVGAWRYEPLHFAGKTRHAITFTDPERAAVNRRLDSKSHDKEPTDNEDRSTE